MYKVNIYIETDSVSPKSMDRWYGYILECTTGSGQLTTKEGFTQLIGTYNQATLTAMIEAVSRLNQSCEVNIHTGNNFIINMIENNMAKWAAAGFLTSKGEPVANQEEWMLLWAMAQKQLITMVPGKHEYSKWLQSEMEKRK